MSFVELNNIRVSYDGKHDILKQLHLSIKKGELVSLLGPSGCGKTTTLRVMAGLISPNDGSFLVDGDNMTKVPTHKRRFGMVFQSYALFPHLTIFDNVAFGLKLRKESKESIKEKVNNSLSSTDLLALSDRYPKQLSGGQRQRVALARALVVEPKLLLLDEPLSNLDAKLRIQMRMEIKKIQQSLGITTVFVTHDQEECFSISDRVAVMNKGVIEQFDSPEAIYRQPKTKFVAQFIGFENFIPLKKQGDHLYLTEHSEKLESIYSGEDGKNLVGTIRPDDIKIVQNDGANTITGTVKVRTFLGKSYQYEVATAVGDLIVNGDNQDIYQTDDQLRLQLPKEKLIILTDNDEKGA